MRICLVTLFAFTAFSVLTGCGASFTDTAAPAPAHIEIQGTVFSAQRPLAGAHVSLLAANTASYGDAAEQPEPESGFYRLLRSHAFGRQLFAGGQRYGMHLGFQHAGVSLRYVWGANPTLPNNHPSSQP